MSQLTRETYANFKVEGPMCPEEWASPAGKPRKYSIETSRYLTIFSQSITLNLRNIFLTNTYPAELQLNKANTSDKKTFFLGFKYTGQML